MYGVVERVFVPTLRQVDVTRPVTLLDSSGVAIYGDLDGGPHR
jgi:hypothetical protein